MLLTAHVKIKLQRQYSWLVAFTNYKVHATVTGLISPKFKDIWKVNEDSMIIRSIGFYGSRTLLRKKELIREKTNGRRLARRRSQLGMVWGC